MKKLSFLLIAGVTVFALSAFIPKQNTTTETETSLAQTPTKWKVDKAHSTVRFSVSHMVVSEAEGTFKSFDGTIEHTKADLSDAKINFTADVNSINTDNENRDKHLKSDDFFNAEKFPTITFVGKSFTPKGGNKYELVGDLTIRDVTKEVKFDATFGGVLNGQRGKKAGFKATATIDRFVFGLKWSRTVEAGGLAVGQNVDITVKLEMDEVK
jgi:polyisoprenoid-binding protein YceI